MFFRVHLGFSMKCRIFVFALVAAGSADVHSSYGRGGNNSQGSSQNPDWRVQATDGHQQLTAEQQQQWQQRQQQLVLHHQQQLWQQQQQLWQQQQQLALHHQQRSAQEVGADWAIDEIFAACPNIERNAIINALVAEAGENQEVRRFLLTLVYMERRRSMAAAHQSQQQTARPKRDNDGDDDEA